MSIKTISKSALIISAVAFSASAVANVDFKPYVGGQIDYSKSKYDSDFKSSLDTTSISLKNKKPSLSIFAGGKLHENFGVEIGYDFHKDRKASSTTSDASVKLSSPYIEAHGYYAVSEEVDLIGAFGFASVKVKSKITTTSVDNDQSKLKYRLGVGASYKFDDNLSARAMYKRQAVNFAGVKNIQSLGLGVAYSF